MNPTLQVLLDHAERQRDQTQQVLQQAQTQLRHLQQQAEQLQGYRDDTHGRGPLRSGRPTGVQALHTHRVFVDRLDTALVQQQRQIAAHEQRCARLRELLLAQELHLASIRKLLSRREAQALAQHQRREQRHSDEFAQQSYWRAREAAASGPR